MPFDFDGMHLEIRIKKYGIFNPPVLASAMIRVFPSLEHSAGHVRIPETICRTFVPHLPVLPQ